MLEQWLMFLKGFTLGLGLIVAIGPQNAFILRRGLKNKHVLIVTMTCFCSDILLFSIGVFALAPILSIVPTVKTIAVYCAVAFLFAFGLFSFRSVFKTHSLDAEANIDNPHYKKTDTIWGSFLIALALSFFNPHAILDTAVIYGSISAQTLPHLRGPLFFGAILASCVWFFGLGYGSKKLNPFFKNPQSWKILDFAIGCIMFGLAFILFYKEMY